MMKTALSTIALATAASAANVNIVGFFTNTATLSADCKAEISTVEIKEFVVNPTTKVYYLFNATPVDEAKFTKCKVGLTAVTDEKVKACVAINTTTATQVDLKSGTNATCPVGFGQTCVAANFCETFGTAETKCPTTGGKCLFEMSPKLWQVVAKSSKVAWEAAPWPADSDSMEDAFSEAAVVANTAAAGCTPGISATGTSWLNNAKEMVSVSGADISTACTKDEQKKWTDAFTAEWDKSSKAHFNGTTVSITMGAVESAQFSKCFTAADGELGCKKMEGCTIPCAFGDACANNAECSSKVCDTAKKCTRTTSGSVMAVVAPVLAAVVAVAFF